MSSNLYVRPWQPDKNGETLPSELKYKIAERFWDHDGSLSGAWITVGEENLDYFHGLSDADVDGADEIIKLIKKHNKVEISIKH